MLATCSTLKTIETISIKVPENEKFQERRPDIIKTDDSEQDKNQDEDKECSSILSVMSNEEVSITSEILDQKSFVPRKNSDGEDINGHIGHIDSPETDTFPNSDALHGESLMDDISSMLGHDLCGFDQDSMENTYTDDTTLFTSDELKPDKQKVPEFKLMRRKSEDIKSESKERKKSLRRNSADKVRRTSRIKMEEDAQFGFENRAFMTQHVFLDNRFENEPVKYCSLAQFVEGNDIARRSFKRHKGSTKLSKTELNANRQSTLTEESEGSLLESKSLKGSKTSLNKMEKELSNVSVTTALHLEKVIDKPAEEDKSVKFPQVSVIVEPPSPIHNGMLRDEHIEKLAAEINGGSDLDLRNLGSKPGLSTSDVTTSNNSSNSNLLDTEHFLSCSPAATRRISCCSMLNSNEAAALARAAAATSKFYSEAEKRDKKEEKDLKDNRKMPIINPLVRLPAWPSK